MHNKKILVTGSAGFIGFHVAKKLLDEGNMIVGIDNLNDYYDVSLKEERNKQLLGHNSYSFFQADISNLGELEEIFRLYKFDKICHLAAQAGVRYSLTNPSLYIDTNIRGFSNILEIARNQGINDIVYASSSSVYGNNSMPTTGFSEKDDVNQPISIYGMTKRSNELMAYTYHHLYKMNLTGLRFFTAYGPWGRPDMAYYSFTKSILEGKPIKVYNNGNMRRDFTYIDDVVCGVVSALGKPDSNKIFNIGNSQTVELKYFIERIEKELGKKAILQLEPLQPGDVLETFADISSAKESLGFNPQTKIEEGIKRFVEWYGSYYKRV